MPRHVRNDRTRVWLMQGGASFFTVPSYEGLMKAGTPRYTRGAGNPVTDPDPDRLGEFIEVDTLPAARTKPQLPLTGRYTYELSKFLEMVNQGCTNDIQVHVGFCQDPKDFNGGWDKILCLEAAEGDDYGMSGDLGALNEGDRAIVDETVTFSGTKLFEIGKINLSEQAATQIEKEVKAITICDRVSCAGACGRGSDGCMKIFAVELFGGTTPGAKAVVSFSEDGGATWDQSEVGTMGAAEVPTAIACVGRAVVVVGSTGIHYADIEELLDGDETWVKMAVGFTLPAGAPSAIVSLGTSQSWLVGAGGYIYFADDIQSEVVIQDAGNSTTENLTAIRALDENVLVAVGENNTVLFTENGGEAWTLVTGPTPAVDLLAVAVRSADEWGVTTAGGELWATKNQGLSWSKIPVPGQGSGSLRAIEFSNRHVGYMAQVTGAGAGRLLRTINGGKSWYVLPEGSGSIPTNQALNSIAVCANPNRVFAGGLGTGTDGIIVKGS